MPGPNETRARRYSPSIRVAAEALYGSRAKRALEPAIPLRPEGEAQMRDMSRVRDPELA